MLPVLFLGTGLVLLGLRLALPPLLRDDHDLKAPQLLELTIPHVYLRVVRAVFTI